MILSESKLKYMINTL